MAVVAIPPKVYHPRAVVALNVLLDDQVPGSVGQVVAYTVIPRSVQWSKNSARKADTAMVELSYRDFPMDPRMLRGILVSIHVEDVFDPAIPPIPTLFNRRFIGLADTPETNLSNDGETVRLTCRDYTGIWIDTKFVFKSPSNPAGEPPISLIQPLSAIVEALRLLVTPLIPPVVFEAAAASAAAFIPGQTKGSAFLTTRKDQSAWDVLSELTQLYGLLPVFDGDTLTIRTATRTSANLRSLVYGQNVSSLSFKRDMSQEPQTKVIVVNAWDPVLGVSTTGQFAPPGALGNTVMKENGVPVVKVTGEAVTYNVVGAYTPLDLIVIAKRIFDEQGTQQLEGELETKEMEDTTALNLLGLANSDVLILRLGRDLQSSISGMSPAEAIAFLSNPARPNSLAPIVAQALVQAWTVAGQTAITFYVREAHHSWDIDQGYTLRVNFINFLIGQGA